MSRRQRRVVKDVITLSVDNNVVFYIGGVDTFRANLILAFVLKQLSIIKHSHLSSLTVNTRDLYYKTSYGRNSN
jgi:hypothetical protein